MWRYCSAKFYEYVGPHLKTSVCNDCTVTPKTLQGTNAAWYCMGWGFKKIKLVDGTSIYVLPFLNELGMIVDINGVKGPNILGKDSFLFVLDFDKNRLVPFNAGSCDKAFSTFDTNGYQCARRIMRDGWQIKYDW